MRHKPRAGLLFLPRRYGRALQLDGEIRGDIIRAETVGSNPAELCIGDDCIRYWPGEHP